MAQLLSQTRRAVCADERLSRIGVLLRAPTVYGACILLATDAHQHELLHTRVLFVSPSCRCLMNAAGYPHVENRGQCRRIGGSVLRRVVLVITRCAPFPKLKRWQLNAAYALARRHGMCAWCYMPVGLQPSRCSVPPERATQSAVNVRVAMRDVSFIHKYSVV